MMVDEVVREKSRGYWVSVGKPEEKRLCERPVREWRVILIWIVRNYDLRMYVRTYVPTCVCMYYVFTYVHVCVCVYVCTYVCNVRTYYVYVCIYVCVCVYIYICLYILIIKPTRFTISQIHFGIEFHMFRTGLLSLIRSLVLYAQQQVFFFNLYCLRVSDTSALTHNNTQSVKTNKLFYSILNW